MPSDYTRGDSSAQRLSSLRETLAYFPKPPGTAGTPAAKALSVPPPHAAPGGGARATHAPAPGSLPGYTPQEHLQLMVGSLRERQQKGPWHPAHPANQQPKRPSSKAGSIVASVTESISQNGSQVGSDSSGQGSQISTGSGYAGSSSSLSGTFTGPVAMDPGIAIPEDTVPEGLSSLGASLHRLGQCTPCKFIRSLRGCRDGSICKLCHEPHEELSRSGVRKAARTKALQRRAMIEKAEVAAAAGAAPDHLRETTALDQVQVSAVPWLRDNFNHAPGPGRAPSVSSVSTSVPGSRASSSHAPSDGPSSYCQVFSF